MMLVCGLCFRTTLVLVPDSGHLYSDSPYLLNTSVFEDIMPHYLCLSTMTFDHKVATVQELHSLTTVHPATRHSYSFLSVFSPSGSHSMLRWSKFLTFSPALLVPSSSMASLVLFCHSGSISLSFTSTVCATSHAAFCSTVSLRFHASM